MPRVQVQGHTVNRRTARMIAEAELIGGPLRITQGSYSDGVNSAGTHHGGGVVDFSTRGLRLTQINRRVRALRLVGFAAWHRTEADGFTSHIHAVAVGTNDLDPAAARQVAALRRGRNGLANNGLDRHRGMGISVHSWETYKESMR